MTRRLGSGSLVIATHNAGKLKEISALLDPYGVKCLSAGSLGLPEPAETGSTFAQNALLKAHASASAAGLPALADDDLVIGQSLAIIEYLEETHPEPPLLPTAPLMLRCRLCTQPLMHQM
mgnify:CR=1 FL=1